MNRYEIWIGRPYFAGRAYKVGEAEGKTFRDACISFFSERHDRYFDADDMTYMRVKLFPFDPELWRKRLERKVEECSLQPDAVERVLRASKEVDFMSSEEEILINGLVWLLDNYDEIIS